MIKIPEPKAGETQKEFISRCIPFLIHEGKHPNTPKGRKAAAGECYGLWRSKHKSEEKLPIKAGLRDKVGYFCKLESSENRYYYELDKPETKDEAMKKAEEEWIGIQIEEIAKVTEEVPTPVGIKEGITVTYKGNKAKILKVIKI